MLLNIDLLNQILPFWHMWGYGFHMGGFSPFLLFFGLLILFAVLRGSGGRNRRPPGYYRPQPPRYHQGSPFERHDPESGDLPRPEQNLGGPGRYNPYVAQDSTSRGAPYDTYGTPTPLTGQGEPTVRVHPRSGDQGQPTVRVAPPAATMRVESAETAGHPTTPLGGTSHTPESPGTEPD